MNETVTDLPSPLIGTYRERGLTHDDVRQIAALRYLLVPLAYSTFLTILFAQCADANSQWLPIWIFALASASLPAFGLGLFVGYDLYRLLVRLRKPLNLPLLAWVGLFMFVTGVHTLFVLAQSRLRASLFISGKNAVGLNLLFHLVALAIASSVICLIPNLETYVFVLVIANFNALFLADTWTCSTLFNCITSDGLAPAPPKLFQFSLGTLLAAWLLLGTYVTVLVTLYEFLPTKLN